MVELGGLHGAEERRLILEIDVPAITELGPASACELELRWVEIATMEQKLARIPVNVNVVPGDQAAGRVRDPEVETEVAFQSAQRLKRDAADAVGRGDIAGALGGYDAACKAILSARPHASGRMAEELDEEVRRLRDLSERAQHDRLSARKAALADHHLKSRRRGRQR